MATYDYSQAPTSSEFDLIPAGTIATVEMKIRPGGAGEGGLLRRSKDGGCEMLDTELVVVDGTHAKRKFWERLVLAGTTPGHEKAADISRGKLRAIIESARGIHPNDMGEQARIARTVELKEFDGIRFMAKIGIEKGTPKSDGSGEAYSDKNMLAAIITKDKKDWHPVDQMPTTAPFDFGGAGAKSPTAPATPAIKPPSWASS